jgi:hypothetical protein
MLSLLLQILTFFDFPILVKILNFLSLVDTQLLVLFTFMIFLLLLSPLYKCIKFLIWSSTCCISIYILFCLL